MSWPLVLAVLAAGAAWALTGEVRRYVPAGSPWLRSRAHVLLAAAAGTWAAVVSDGTAERVAVTVAGVGCALLAVVDLSVRRLPDRLVGATAVGLLAALTVAAATTGEWAALGRAVLSAVVLVTGYFLLAFTAPAGLGLGDVKFAGVLGALLGWFGWSHVAVGTLLAFVLNAVVALAVLASRRGTRESQVPFGPAMIAGAVLALTIT